MLLGLGCNVPGILATRILESEKERFVVTVLIPELPPASRPHRSSFVYLQPELWLRRLTAFLEFVSA